MSPYKLFDKNLQSPFIIGSGPLSYSGEAMVRLHREGAGAVVTKTIRLEAAVNPVPHMLLHGPSGLINCEKWADLPPEQWIEKEIPLAKKSGAVVIASVGHTLAESGQLVAEVARAGADMIELVSYNEQDLVPMLEDAKRKVDIPVLAKLTPNQSDIVQMAGQCLDAGADGLTACDSVGPVLRIDTATGRPMLAGKDGYGWLSGAAIKPIILQKVAELRRHYNCPIVGLGGVTTAEDALEIAMAGANLIGICSVVICKGVQVIRKLDQELGQLLNKYGHGSLDEVTGKVIPYLYPEEKLGQLEFHFDPEKCSNCRRCVQLCPYQARTLNENKEMKLDEDSCRHCGFCASACYSGALSFKN